MFLNASWWVLLEFFFGRFSWNASLGTFENELLDVPNVPNSSEGGVTLLLVLQKVPCAGWWSLVGRVSKSGERLGRLSWDALKRALGRSKQ